MRNREKRCRRRTSTIGKKYPKKIKKKDRFSEAAWWASNQDIPILVQQICILCSRPRDQRRDYQISRRIAHLVHGFSSLRFLSCGSSCPFPNPEISTPATVTNNKNPTNQQTQQVQSKANHHDAKELHMFVWSSSASPVSEGGGLHVFGRTDFGSAEQFGRSDQGAKEIRMIVADHPQTMGEKGNNNTDKWLQIFNFIVLIFR